MPTLTIQITATTVAWYAAIVSTTAVLINLFSLTHSVVSNLRNVKLEIRPNKEVVPDGLPPHPPDTLFTELYIINRGHRPVTITAAGAKLKKTYPGKANHWLINPIGFQGGYGRLPYELTDGKAYSVLALQKQITDNLKHIDYFLVCEATGKEYQAKMTEKLKKSFIFKEPRSSCP